MVNALAVVAHHDDHILWMGGTIQRTKKHGWNWTLIAMCVPDPVKQSYFCGCCGSPTANPCYFTFNDYFGGEPFSQNVQSAMQADLMKTLAGQRFDWVFTHSRKHECEYGRHANHVEVQTVVTSLVRSASIGNGLNHLAYFNYELYYGGPGSGIPTVAVKTAGAYYLPLDYPELYVKSHWTTKIPDSLAGIDYPCPNPESFEGDGLQLPLNVFKRL